MFIPFVSETILNIRKCDLQITQTAIALLAILILVGGFSLRFCIITAAEYPELVFGEKLATEEIKFKLDSPQAAVIEPSAIALLEE